MIHSDHIDVSNAVHNYKNDDLQMMSSLKDYHFDYNFSIRYRIYRCISTPGKNSVWWSININWCQTKHSSSICTASKTVVSYRYEYGYFFVISLKACHYPSKSFHSRSIRYKSGQLIPHLKSSRYTILRQFNTHIPTKYKIPEEK